jgi:hypothetical protein
MSWFKSNTIDLARALKPRLDATERSHVLNWQGRENAPRQAGPERAAQTVNRGPVFGRRGRGKPQR